MGKMDEFNANLASNYYANSETRTNLEVAHSKFESEQEDIFNKIENLQSVLNTLNNTILNQNKILSQQKSEKEKIENDVDIKYNDGPFKAETISLKKFLERINNYPDYDSRDNGNSEFYYKGVLINSFYDLEFNFQAADKNINDILRCRCVSIGIPNIRKNYTAINFNGRRVEIEQNAEFQHEIQLRIICDEDADIYYKFKEYIDCTKNKKPYKLFNDSYIWIALDGFKVIRLNYITIADLGQLEFDNSPSSNICFFNVSLKVIDYEFNSNIIKKNKYDKLLEDILKNKNEIKIKENEKENTENELNRLRTVFDENKGQISYINSQLDKVNEFSKIQ